MMPRRFLFSFVSVLGLVAVACGGDTAEEHGLVGASASKIRIFSGYCGAPAGKCSTSRVEVDFAAKTVTTSACNDVRGPRALTDAEIDRIRGALGNVRVTKQEDHDQDGVQFKLTVVTSEGETIYDYPNARCGPLSAEKVVSGFEELQKAIPSP